MCEYSHYSTAISKIMLLFFYKAVLEKPLFCTLLEMNIL
jgi:hypothetical protein